MSRIAVVTGGTRGIGEAISRSLRDAGYRVTALYAGREDRARAFSEETGIEALKCDVGNFEQCAETVTRIASEAGPVDVLVNNAGIIGPISPVASADPNEWMQNIAINLDGIFLTCRYALPAMMERDWGRIVNVSSGAARGTTYGWSAYSAAKAGVEVFTGVLAREVANSGVRVNAVRPGIVDTEMQVEIRGSSEDRFSPENVERFRGYKERGLLRNPDDPARLILWLLSPEADDINGETLAIDDPGVAAKIGLVPMGR